MCSEKNKFRLIICIDKMTDSHNYRSVGYSMIAIAISLTIIALLYVVIGNDVLYGDKVQRNKTSIYEENKGQLEFNKLLENSLFLIWNGNNEHNTKNNN